MLHNMGSNLSDNKWKSTKARDVMVLSRVHNITVMNSWYDYYSVKGISLCVTTIEVLDTGVDFYSQTGPVLLHQQCATGAISNQL